ncbi:MAG: zinc-ribbon domain-containing protein [Nitrosopumilaceae archaeon]
MMSDKESKDDRFYEPRNWDKFMRIDDEVGHEVSSFCGKCGHVIYEGDRFCTKCGAKKREEKKD